MVVKKSGFKEGGLYAQNFQAYSGVITTDGSGDGTTSVTFKKVMDNVPNGMGLVATTSITTGVFSVQDVTNSGMTVKVDGCSNTTSTVTFKGLVYDDTYF